jgi:hypothetical protein
VKYLTSRLVWGILLVVGGIVFLLQNLQVVALGDLFWTIIFGAAGLAFLSVSLTNRQQWWALIPGITLLAIGLLILLNFIFPDLEGRWGGLVFLGGIGVAFFLVYLSNRENWWAVIPAGVLLTLAIISSTEGLISDLASGGLFFLGLGVTFALVAIIPNPHGRMAWAYIPASILGVIGLLMMATSVDIINYLWPAALILLGLYLVLRVFFRKKELR